MCAETGLLRKLNKMRAGTVQDVHQSSQLFLNKKGSLLHVMTLKTAVVMESVQLIIIEANQLAILQVWIRV